MVALLIVVVPVVDTNDADSYPVSDDVIAESGSIETVGTYQVRYGVEGVTSGIEFADPVFHAEGETVTVLGNEGNLLRKGYTFSAWTYDGEDYDTGSTFQMPAFSIQMEPKWTVNDYKVTFLCPDETGTSINNTTKVVTFDTAYGTLPEPIREGYTFDGWYLDSIFTIRVTSETIVSTGSDHNLYVKWLGISYTVTYICPDENETSFNNTTKIVRFGSIYGNLSLPIQTGYTFDGWYLDSSFSKSVTPETTMSTDSDHNIYAKWTVNDYTVTYSCPNETGSKVNNTTFEVTFDTAYGRLSEPVRNGYAFDGWYLERTHKTLVTSSTIVSTNSDHSLYAKWAGNSYTVTYICPDETETKVNGTTKEVTFGSQYGELSQPVKLGYTFDGWYHESTLENLIAFDSIVATDSDHNLYAKWAPLVIIFGDDVDSVEINGTAVLPGAVVELNDTIEIMISSSLIILDVENAVPIDGAGMFTPDGHGAVTVLVEDPVSGMVIIPSLDEESAFIGSGYDPTVSSLNFKISDELSVYIERNNETKQILDENGVTKSIDVIMRFIDYDRFKVDVYIGGIAPTDLYKEVEVPCDLGRGTPKVYYDDGAGNLEEMKIIHFEDDSLIFSTDKCSVYEIVYSDNSGSEDNSFIYLMIAIIVIIALAFVVIILIKKHII